MQSSEITLHDVPNHTLYRIVRRLKKDQRALAQLRTVSKKFKNIINTEKGFFVRVYMPTEQQVRDLGLVLTGVNELVSLVYEYYVDNRHIPPDGMLAHWAKVYRGALLHRSIKPPMYREFEMRRGAFTARFRLYMREFQRVVLQCKIEQLSLRASLQRDGVKYQVEFKASGNGRKRLSYLPYYNNLVFSMALDDLDTITMNPDYPVSVRQSIILQFAMILKAAINRYLRYDKTRFDYTYLDWKFRKAPRSVHRLLSHPAAKEYFAN